MPEASVHAEYSLRNRLITLNQDTVAIPALEISAPGLTSDNKLTFEELFDYNGCYLPYNPKIEDIKNSTFDSVIDYFCELEEYEKCAEIKKVKDSKNNKE